MDTAKCDWLVVARRSRKFSLDSLCPTGWARLTEIMDHQPVQKTNARRAKRPMRRRHVLGSVSRHPMSPGGTLTKMAGVAGLEPVTSAVTGQRSNQLSYTPAKGTMKIGKAAGGVKFCFQFYLEHGGQRFRWHARASLPVLGINRRSSRIAFNGMDTG